MITPGLPPMSLEYRFPTLGLALPFLVLPFTLEVKIKLALLLEALYPIDVKLDLSFSFEVRRSWGWPWLSCSEVQYTSWILGDIPPLVYIYLLIQTSLVVPCTLLLSQVVMCSEPPLLICIWEVMGSIFFKISIFLQL